MSKFDTVLARESLVPSLDFEEFGPKLYAFNEEAVKTTGQLSGSMRAMAHADEMAFAARSFLKVAGAGGTIGAELTILIRLLVSNLNTCLYCSSHQLKRIAKLGVSAEKTENIHDFETHAAFSDEERAALAFAKALTQDSANIPDDICARFTSTFAPKQRVEIAFITIAMDVLNKFNDGLRIPIDDDSMEMAQLAAERIGK